MTQQQAHVPKFGNWDDGDESSHTQRFDNARSNKAKAASFSPIHPNSRNSGQSPQFRVVSEPDVSNPKDQDSRKSIGEINGSQRSPKSSPLHPHSQARSAGQVGTGSPARERRAAHETGRVPGSGTPGRSRMKSTEQVHEIPEKSSMVPRFGDWDDGDPTSADAYSDIFNKVREEKKSRAKSPMITTEPDFSTFYAEDKSEEKKKSSFLACFGWCKH